MLASVLKSDRAVAISIIIVKTFVRLRQIMIAHKDLADKLSELEHKIERHDAEIQAIFDAIRQLMSPLIEKRKEKIGFVRH
jgi:cell division protein FtsB